MRPMQDREEDDDKRTRRRTTLYGDISDESSDHRSASKRHKKISHGDEDDNYEDDADEANSSFDEDDGGHSALPPPETIAAHVMRFGEILRSVGTARSRTTIPFTISPPASVLLNCPECRDRWSHSLTRGSVTRRRVTRGFSPSSFVLQVRLLSLDKAALERAVRSRPHPSPHVDVDGQEPETPARSLAHFSAALIRRRV